MSLVLITPPAESITLADAKLHQRIEHSADDVLVAAFITAAREAAEHQLGCPLGAQTWRQTLDAFPAAELFLGPAVSAITSIQYIDPAGAVQTLPSAAYVLDNADPSRCFVLPADGYTWPTTDDGANAVRITFVCGLNPVPESVRAWMLLRIGTLYQQRAEVAAGTPLSGASAAFTDRLLDRYKVYG